MQTRRQFLNSLTPLPEVPKDLDECAVCLEEEYTGPVQLSCSHIFCKPCIYKWCDSRGASNSTCPTCRQKLFDVNGDSDRTPEGADRLQIVAQALEHSSLLTEDSFDGYSDELCFSACDVHHAAAHAYQYLAAASHSPVTGPVLVKISVLGPALIAMGNLLRGYAQATGRPYSGYQRRDWKLIIRHLMNHLELANGEVRESGVGMAREFGGRIRYTLEQDLIDLRSGRFFESRASVHSPSGDLDVVLNYVVHVSAKAYQEREARSAALRQAQKDALTKETNSMRWVLRKAAQVVFNRV